MKIYRTSPEPIPGVPYSRRLDEIEIDILMDIPSDCFIEGEDGALMKVSKEELADSIRNRMARRTA